MAAAKGPSRLPSHLAAERAAPFAELDALAIGKRMAAFRDHLGLSQAELADRISGSKMGLQGNERGVSAPNSRTLFGLVLLGANVNWVLDGSGPMLRANLQAPRPALDNELLTGVLQGVEAVLAEQRLELTPEKKGELVALLYEQCASEGAVRPATILRLVKLAA